MHPQICKIGPFTVYSYGVMLILAFVAGTFLARQQARKQNINPELISNLTFIAFVAGIAGARILYVLGNLPYYMSNPIEIIMLQHGGLSWFGGLIAGSISAVIYIKKNKQSLYEILDLIVPFLALAHAIGRIGCLLNGCCYGKESAFGIYFKSLNAILIPTQLYSSLALISIFIILRFLQDRPHWKGQVFYAYLLFYSLARFCIEFFRADNPIIFLGLTVFQLFSIAAFVVGVSGLLITRKPRK